MNKTLRKENRMKVYYQELNGQKCVCDNIEDLRHDLEIALDEFEELEIKDETELKKDYR